MSIINYSTHKIEKIRIGAENFFVIEIVYDYSIKYSKLEKECS